MLILAKTNSGLGHFKEKQWTKSILSSLPLSLTLFASKNTRVLIVVVVVVVVNNDLPVVQTSREANEAHRTIIYRLECNAYFKCHLIYR